MATVLSGEITVTTAGTAVQGTSTTRGTFLITFNPDEGAGYGFIGNNGSGDVADGTGFMLKAGDKVTITLANLNSLYFDTSVNGDKFSWLKIAGNEQDTNHYAADESA